MDFDRFSHNYKETLNSSLGIFGKNGALFDSYKITCIKDWLVKNDAAYDILDFGCGIGKITALLARGFSKSTIYGYDISKESLSVAKRENTELKNIYFIDDLSRGHKFDFVVVVGVFHHIKPNERIATLCRLKELLKSGGRIIIFEHNPLNPLTRHIVNRCPFDSDAKLIRCNKFKELARTSGFKIEKKLYVLFFPLQPGIFRRIEYFLGHLPFGAQYMVSLVNE